MSFEYHEPATRDEALELLARYGDDAMVLAGGTAFVLLLRQGLIRPGHVVALRRLPDAAAIARADGGALRIGAMATHRAVETSKTVRAAWPELADAVGKVATIRIRNQATLGGSLAHADPASDAPVMLAALGADALVAGPPGGTPSRVPVEDLLVDTFTTSLAPGHLLDAIEVPARRPGTRAVYLKFTPNTRDDYATVAVAATARIEGGTWGDLRIVLGAAGPKPMRARHVEDALRGQRADAARVGEAAALVEGDVDPMDDVRGSAAYKRDMARVWTERALRSLMEARA